MPADAAAGVDGAELRALLVEHWAFTLEHAPLWATELGVHRFDDRLRDESEEAILAERQMTREFLRRGRDLHERSATLSERDRVTLEVFLHQLNAQVETDVCEYFRWALDPRNNLLTELIRLPEVHRVVSEADARNLLARYKQIPTLLRQHGENLRSGAARGLVANARSTRTLIELLEKQLVKAGPEWPLVKPALAERPDWAPGFRRFFSTRLQELVTSQIIPAFRWYASMLRTEVLPKARGVERESLLGLAQGRQCYAAEIRANTTLDVSAEHLHGVGMAELERINREMTALGRKLFGAPELTDVLRALRQDRDLYFATADEIVESANAALSAAKRALPEFFSTIPSTDCVVRAIPAYESNAALLAYYRPPHADGSKPGEFFVNTSSPSSFPRFSLSVLTFHESIPGHHLQIAVAQEAGDLPAFRKHSFVTAFVEGWGLYAERLAVEMSLYASDLDQMGRLDFEAWRAARLVVDTGLHASGWTRERAVGFMLEHTALSQQNIETEVDRYLVMPGQALAYKTGQLEILRLRERAREKLGARFRLAAFHDAVLSKGAVPLPILARQVAHWLGERK